MRLTTIRYATARALASWADWVTPTPPALIIHSDSVECPCCGAVGSLTEVDTAERWNDGDVEVTNGKITAMWWGAGDGDYSHTRYQCGNCFRTLRIDQNTDNVSQDWS
jgi:hypothetical protein